MSASKVYRGGAIGRTGRGDYGHGLHLGMAALDCVDVVAVADPDEEGRTKAAVQVGATRTYEKYEEMLATEDLDVVTVGPRWVDCHEEMVLACIDAGCHVYCEKPMVPSLDVGDHLVCAAKNAGIKVAIAHQAVYLPQVGHVKKMIDNDEIGTLQAIHVHGKQDRRGGGEDMIVLGTHLFNLMRFFAGDVAWMSGQVTANGKGIEASDVREGGEPIGLIAGDSVDSFFVFESGVRGFFDTRAFPEGNGKPYGMELIGDKGRIALRGGGVTEAHHYPHGVWEPSQNWKAMQLEPIPLGDGNRRAILDLLEAVEVGREPVSSGRDAVKALEMILGVYESQITGARVQFPMKNREHPLSRLTDQVVQS
jgi:predicted dehydrogenase